jgi:electron transfer flavoprotein alpha subunit
MPDNFNGYTGQQSSFNAPIHLAWCVLPFSGNAVTTIKSNDKVKVFTVRGTSFEPAPADGGDAVQENGRI